MPRITQADLARRLGLSQVAVSLALRGHKRIAADTRERVRALAEELGYRPDPVLSTLAAQRWKRATPAYHGTVALLVQQRAYTERQSWQEQLTARSLRERLLAVGYQMVVFGQDDYTPAALGRVLRQRGIRGLFYTRISGTRWRDEFAWSEFASVAVNYSYFDAVQHSVVFERFPNILDLWARLHLSGFARIGVIAFDEPQAHDYALCEAAIDYARRLRPGGAHLPTLRLPPNRSSADWRGPIREWRRLHSPDYCVAWNELILERVRSWEGNTAPLPGCAFCSSTRDYPLPGYFEDYDRLAQAAVDVLHAQLQNTNAGLPTSPYRAVVPREWREEAELGANARHTQSPAPPRRASRAKK